MPNLRLISACAAALLATSHSAAWADVVVAGSDYFLTVPGSLTPSSPPPGGTWGNIPGVGTILFQGVDFGPGGADTIIQRQADATINGPPVSIQITGLQLESEAPVAAFGNINVYASLDPTRLGNDTGTLTVSGTSAGGTFSSTLNVYFDICTTVGVNGVGCGSGTLLGTGSYTGSTVGTSTGSEWSSTPLPGQALVTGSVGDLAANSHSGLSAGEVDFFPGVSDGLPFPVVTCFGTAGCHEITPAPEPGTVALLGTALLGLAGWRHRAWRK
ncbi:MAG: PEP-CTERM sorting domain-containing protein [Acetobacteraceae bacterium]|jgi:hypothetical protein